LQEHDVFSYIDHRIRIAGGGRAQLFSDKAVKQISRLSKGIPRLINLLCDRALLGAYVEEKDLVDQNIVDKAALEVFGGGRYSERRKGLLFSPLRLQSILLIVLLLALILTGTALVYYSPKLIGFPSLTKFTTSEAPAEKVSETIPAKVIPQGHKFRTSRQAAQLSFKKSTKTVETIKKTSTN
jgi:general secretion pathway protein A